MSRTVVFGFSLVCVLVIGGTVTAAAQQDQAEADTQPPTTQQDQAEADSQLPSTQQPAPPAELPSATYPAGVLPDDWAVPGSYQAAVQRDGLSLVARGYEGLALLRISGEHSRLVSTFGAGLEIVGVRWAGDDALVRTARGEVLLLDVSDAAFPRVSLLLPATAVESTDEGILQRTGSEVPVPPVPVAGRVVQVQRGALIIDQGAEQGLRAGMHLKISSVQPVNAIDIESNTPIVRESGATVGVVEIIEVSATRARAWLGPGDDARAGDRAQSTSEPSTGNPAVLTVSAVVRPMLGIESLSFGMINDLRVDYRFHKPIRLGVSLAPLAFDVGRDGAGFLGGVAATADLDANFFSLGAGVGYSWSRYLDKGLVFRQSVRFGSLDGLHFAGFNEFVLAMPNDDLLVEDFSRDEATFIWGGFHAMFRWPTGKRARMAIDGRYGVNGHAYTLFDMHISLFGRGGPGTLWLKTGGGVGWLWDVPPTSSTTYDLGDEPGVQYWHPGPIQIGPVFAIGLEWVAPVPRSRPPLSSAE